MGFLGEVEGLLARYPAELKPLQSLGYRHLGKFLRGEWTWEEAVERLVAETLLQVVERLEHLAIRTREHFGPALGTGLRLGEIVDLNVGDMYLPDGPRRSRVRLQPRSPGGC